MSSPAFDTHTTIKSLTKAGTAEPAAEAIVAAIAVGAGDHLATKDDLKILRKDMKSDMKIHRKETKADIDSLEQRMTIRLGGIMVVGIGVLAVLIKFF